ncbi:hypothetical protein ACFL38_05030, partial [Candidatus Omnitrophota bacterium]
VLDDGGCTIMVKLFERIVSRVVTDGRFPSQKDYERYLRPFKKLFSESYNTQDKLKKLKKSISSEGGRNDFLDDVVFYIGNQLGDTAFRGKEKVNKATALEKRFKELIKAILSDKKNPEWLSSYANESQYSKALKHMKQYGQEDVSNAYLHLTFGDCLDIIRKNHDLFKRIFADEYTNQELVGAFSLISRVRNTQEFHYVGVDKKTHDDKLFDIHCEKINKSIDAVVTQEETEE